MENWSYILLNKGQWPLSKLMYFIWDRNQTSLNNCCKVYKSKSFNLLRKNRSSSNIQQWIRMKKYIVKGRPSVCSRHFLMWNGQCGIWNVINVTREPSISYIIVINYYLFIYFWIICFFFLFFSLNIKFALNILRKHITTWNKNFVRIKFLTRN